MVYGSEGMVDLREIFLHYLLFICHINQKPNLTKKIEHLLNIPSNYLL
jgi:hypothetical protein